MGEVNVQERLAEALERWLFHPITREKAVQLSAELLSIQVECMAADQEAPFIGGPTVIFYYGDDPKKTVQVVAEPERRVDQRRPAYVLHTFIMPEGRGFKLETNV